MSEKKKYIYSRNFCYTAWKKPREEIKNDSRVRYHIYGIEVCPNTGKTHYQGYIELKTTFRISTLKKLFDDDTMHIEKRRGTKIQAIEYCKKEGSFFELGVAAMANSITQFEVTLLAQCHICGSDKHNYTKKDDIFYCECKADMIPYSSRADFLKYRKKIGMSICEKLLFP